MLAVAQALGNGAEWTNPPPRASDDYWGFIDAGGVFRKPPRP